MRLKSITKISFEVINLIGRKIKPVTYIHKSENKAKKVKLCL
jgi:hypothetical protein